MDLLTLIAIGVALSMDALAVTIAGISSKYAMQMIFSFALFQSLMPIAGWYGGMEIRHFISSIDHWIAFFILTFVGIKMIFEANKINRINAYTILLLSIATSLDAFAVGISLSFMGELIFIPAFIIGVITFTVCSAGYIIARRIKFLENKMEVIGGIIIIGIGVKILMEHL